MKRIPLYDATKPISCTIERAEVPARIELIERMRTALRSVERSEHGMVLRFPNKADVAADLDRFVVDEKTCCEFWGFAIHPTADELTLQWDAPPGADELVDRLITYFSGDEPITAISGLL